MKDFFYAIFAAFFYLGRLLPIKKDRVVLVSMHNESFHDSLGSLKEELEKRGGYELRFLNKNDLLSRAPAKLLRFFLRDSIALARAEYVFLNDNFLPMSMLRFSPKTVITQLWHAEGVFKKFGFSVSQPPQVRKREVQANARLTYVICSSSNVVPYYAKAFGVPQDKVLPLGSARTDLLFSRQDGKDSEKAFYQKYPQLRGKKLVLYAPTFRDDPEHDKRLLDAFDADKIAETLGKDHALCIRLHPQLHAAERRFTRAVDLTDYDDPVTLVRLCECCITDYSSICMDFVLLSKKVVFYAFDLAWYDSTRSFYFDYETYVPGTVAKTIDELIKALQEPMDAEKQKAFLNFNFGATFDGKSAERIVNTIMKK